MTDHEVARKSGMHRGGERPAKDFRKHIVNRIANNAASASAGKCDLDVRVFGDMLEQGAAWIPRLFPVALACR
ncbi:MAG: hypothetical protein HOQ41_16240 [Ensifer adhaerens]|nr:hypothetical protein [Ensifer adhaerens]